MIEVRTYSIDELVDLTGFSQRNIAYYIQQGLLPKIGRRGRNTRYPQLFVERLRFIQRVRDLQDSGRLGSVTLPRIARVIWHLVERSGDTGELPELDDRELQRLFDDESISDERVLGKTDDTGARPVDKEYYPADVAEMALAHALRDKTEAAYRRGDLFEKRARLMADWARFCSKPTEPASVIPIRQSSA